MIDNMAAYMADRRRERRLQIIARLGGACVSCGSTSSLEVDHVDPSSKTMKLANMLSHSWVKIEAELTKCQLLCRTCHDIKSRLRGEYGGGQNRIVNPQHGTNVMYVRKCRCAACRKWKSDYRAGRVDTLGRALSEGSL